MAGDVVQSVTYVVCILAISRRPILVQLLACLQHGTPVVVQAIKIRQLWILVLFCAESILLYDVSLELAYLQAEIFRN